MERELEAALDERVGPEWKKWGRDVLMETVYKVSYLAAEGADESSWTVTTTRLANIYKSQQNRIERIDDYNRRQAMKQRRDG